MTSSDAAQRILDDPALLERFANEYRGGWEPGDALAWRSNPDAPLVSGAPSPSARLRELQHIVYSERSVSAAADAERELQELSAELDRERAEIDRALGLMAPVESMTSAADRLLDDSSSAPGRPRRRVHMLVGAVCILAGLVIGFGGAQVASLASPSAPGSRNADRVRLLAEAELDRERRDGDRPSVQIGNGFDDDSFRLLSEDSTIGASYLARKAEQICLVHVGIDELVVASCADADEMPPRLQVALKTRAGLPDTALADVDFWMEVSWSPGGLEYGGGLPFGEDP